MSKFKHPGYVYVLTNESLPGLVKIGFTTQAPQKRCDDLYTTGMPSKYRPYFFTFVEDAPAVEEAVHVALYNNRNNMDREFFNIDPASAVESIKKEELLYRADLHKAMYSNKTKTASYLTKSYDNPKFVELVDLLVSNKGKSLLSLKSIAKTLKLSEKGAASVLYVLDKQPTKVLYTQENSSSGDKSQKHGLYVKFGENQLNELDKLYPKLDFSKVKEKMATLSNKSLNKSSKTFSSALNKTKKEIIDDKLEDSKMVEKIILDDKEAVVLWDTIKFLTKRSKLYQDHMANPDSKGAKKPKRFYSKADLSVELKIDHGLLSTTIDKCESDQTMDNCLYYFDKIDQYCLHGDFCDQVIKTMLEEQPSMKAILASKQKIRKTRANRISRPS
jgi:hypothetical protein